MSAKIQNCTWLFDRKEELVQLYKAHKSFPYDVSPATVQRYFRRGIITPNGHFRLETVSCGNKRFTSLEAIERFLRVQQGENAVQTMSIPTSSGMTAAERKREMKRLGLRPQRARYRHILLTSRFTCSMMAMCTMLLMVGTVLRQHWKWA